MDQSLEDGRHGVAELELQNEPVGQQANAAVARPKGQLAHRPGGELLVQGQSQRTVAALSDTGDAQIIHAIDGGEPAREQPAMKPVAAPAAHRLRCEQRRHASDGDRRATLEDAVRAARLALEEHLPTLPIAPHAVLAAREGPASSQHIMRGRIEVQAADTVAIGVRAVAMRIGREAAADPIQQRACALLLHKELEFVDEFARLARGGAGCFIGAGRFEQWGALHRNCSPTATILCYSGPDQAQTNQCGWLRRCPPSLTSVSSNPSPPPRACWVCPKWPSAAP